VGGEALLRARSAVNALLFHESRHLVASALQVLTLRGLDEFASSVDGVVLLPEVLQLGTEFLVADLARRRRTRLDVVVGAGGDLQLFTDRLDSPPTPTGP
jgi:hypothetical protein